VPYSDFKIERELGVGGFAIVYLGARLPSSLFLLLLSALLSPSFLPPNPNPQESLKDNKWPSRCSNL
jgi:hypothetical protein